MKKVLFSFLILLFNVLATAQTISTGTITGSPFCAGAAINIPFSVTGSFNAGNEFNAELSDDAGGFGSPVVIGTLNAVGAGFISASLPFTQAAGTQYRIRITASDPAVTGTDNGTDLIVSPSVSPLSAHTKTWTGATGNWDNPANWSPCGVPNGFSTVLIDAGAVVTVPPASFNTVSIFMSAGAKLIIASGATLNINGSAIQGLQLTGAGTRVTNNGTLHCGNFAPISISGISLFTGSTFINNTGAVISVNNITSTLTNEGDAISIQGNSSFTNSGSIQIGNAANISRSGIFMETNAGFVNENGGSIEINRITNVDGIDIQGSSNLINRGTIQIGNTAAVNRIGLFIVTGSEFNNQTGGSIQINRITTGDAIQAQDNFTKIINSGTIHCGNIAAINRGGLSLFTGSVILNNSSSLITINNITSTVSGEGFGVSISNSNFSNSGTIQVGNTTAISRNGISMFSGAQLTNLTTTAVVEINRVTTADGLTVQAGAVVTNAGIVRIGNIAAVNSFGISLFTGALLTNQTTGRIEVDRITTNDGITMQSSAVVNNSGSIKIGNTIAVNRIGLSLFSASQFNNQGFGTIEINRITTFDGINCDGAGTTLSNAGSINIGNIAAVKRAGIILSTSAALTNNSGATVAINNITSTVAGEGIGLYVLGNSTANNAGVFDVGNATAISRIGIFLTSGGQLTNQAAANLRINRITTLDGIQASGTGTSINNSGSIKFGEAGAIFRSGITMFTAAQFTNQVGALVEINNITSNDGLQLSGTGTAATNNGTINIGNLFGVRRYGVFLSTGPALTNSSTGIITVNNITSVTSSEGYGLSMSGGTFTNSGSFNIGNTAAISRIGILMSSSAQFTNQSTGTVQVNRVTNFSGVQMQSLAKIFNNGIFNIGNTTAIRQECLVLLSAAEFNNNAAATLTINRSTTADGLLLSGTNSKFNNSGVTTIGNLASLPLNGIYAEVGSIVTNNTDGIIEISSALENGIELTSTGTGFVNNGTIKTGTAGAIGLYGISIGNNSSFTNAGGATIEVDNIASFGNGGIGVSAATCSNAGIIKVGNNAQVYRRGIDMLLGGIFNNQVTGQIEISRTSVVSGFGGVFLNGTNTTMNNAGSLKIGVIANTTYHGIVMSGSCIFNNQAGATMEINNLNSSAGIAINYTSGAFSNAGNISIGTVGTSIYRGLDRFLAFGSFTNTGTITFGNITNYGIGGNTNLQNNSGGILQTAAAGFLRVDGTITNNIGATVLNSATGNVLVESGGSIISSGTITNNNSMTNNGTISLAAAGGLLNNNAGATCTSNGIIKGIGTINQGGTFINTITSKIQPGLSPGTLSTSTDFNLGSTLFDIEANGTNTGDFDSLQVNGVVTLTNATLKLTTGFVPVNGDRITVIHANSITGTFANVDAPGWFVNYNTPSTGKVTLSFGRVLPLQLISFSGSRKNTDAELQWRTANEINVLHFELQRSDDGQNFVTIGNVQPGRNLYAFTDAGIFNNKSLLFYRLKSVDIDGRFTISNTLRLQNNLSVNAGMHVFPNPVQDVVTISGLSQSGTIRLFTSEGKLLQQQTVTAQTTTLDMSRYAKGMYLLLYQTGEHRESQKIIKQ